MSERGAMRGRFGRWRAGAVVAAVGFGVVAGACGGPAAEGVSTERAPIGAPPVAGTESDAAPSVPADSSAASMAAVSVGSRPSSVSAVSVDAADLGRDVGATLSTFEEARLEGSTLGVSFRVPSIDEGSAAGTRALWEAAMFGAAFAERLGQLRRDGVEIPLDALELYQVARDGRAEQSGGSGDRGLGTRFEPIRPERLEASAAAAADQLGLTVVEITIERPLDDAAAIVLASPNGGPGEHDVILEAARRLVEDGHLLASLLGRDSASVEGWFVEVRDSTGRGVYATFAANRAGGGGEWLSPDLAVPATHPPPEPTLPD